MRINNNFKNNNFFNKKILIYIGTLIFSILTLSI